MKRVTFLGLAVLVAVAMTAPSACAAKRPSDLTYPKIALETPKYEELQFANGMTGFFIEDHEIPVVNITMLVGTSRAPREKTGLNELAAWAIRNGGSGRWPADKMNEELEFVAASVEFRGEDRATTIRVDCLKKDLGLCLDILGDLLRDPALPEDKIDLRRQTMLENIRRENDDPREIAFREFGRIVYGDHPIAWTPTAESVQAITRDDLVAYHSAFFHPNNTIIGISGDVTRDEIVAALDKTFAGWEPAAVTVEPEPPLTPTYRPSVNYIHKDTNQGVIVIGHLGLNSRDENREAVQVMNSVLGGGSFTSRITQRVRSDEGLAYAASSRYTDDPWTYGLFTASSQTKSEATGRAIGLILDLIKDMQKNGPTREEFQTAVDRYLNVQVFEYESKARVVDRLVRLKWEGRPLDTPEREFRAIAKMTLDDAKKAAAEYLHPDGLTILVVGNAADFDQPLSNFGEVREISLP
jgi:zinc protease